MNGNMIGYSGESDMPAQAMMKEARISTPSVPELLRFKRTLLEQQLKEVNDAIAALEANPEIEKVLHLVSKVGLRGL